MATLYFDHGVPEDLAALLRITGHDSLLTRMLGQLRATDDQQLLTAVQLGRVLVTHNTEDFVLVHHAWRLWPSALGVAWPHHHGILVLPQPARFPIARAADEVDKFLRSGRPIANELFHLTVAGHWLRER